METSESILTYAHRYNLSVHEFQTVSLITSGVVGRERMGTAFPHKKLSGNGVPT